MELPLEKRLRVGFATSVGSPKTARRVGQLAESHGFDSLWTGDHVAFTGPIHDPLLQLAQLAAYTKKILLGTSVFLLPLRNPVIAAKQIATLDHLCEGRFIFGVGVGGEFPEEYGACQVPVTERGARLSEQIPLVKALFRGPTSSEHGRFYRFPTIHLQPAPIQPGGPAIWCGGRSKAALNRIGHMADGWLAYVVTPERYREGLKQIERGAQSAGRELSNFGTAHHLFLRLEDDYESALKVATEHLSQRYAMDFRSPTRKYAALGQPGEVAERILDFARAGVRHFVLDVVGPISSRDDQLRTFANEVRPLLDRQW